MEFQSIEDYYNFIELDNSYPADSNAITALISLRDKTSDANEKDNCFIELLITEFFFKEGQICPCITYANGEQFPDVKMLNGRFDYLIRRADEVVNPKHKALYNHILWVSEAKNIIYGKSAIDSYFLFLKEISYSVSDNLLNYFFRTVFENMFVLSQSINYKREDAINLLCSLLETDKINPIQKCSLMSFITERGKKLEKQTLQTFFDYAYKVIDHNIYPNFLENYLRFQITISQKLSISQTPFYISLGEHLIAKGGKDTDAFVKYDFYQEAMANFQKAGDSKRVEDISVLIERTKLNLNFKLHRFEYEVDSLQQDWDKIRERLNNLIEQGTSNQIFSFLSFADGLLPPGNGFNEDNTSTMSESFSVTNFDINRNITGSKSSPFTAYHLFLKNVTMRYFFLIFSKGYKRGKINYDSLMNYMRTDTWYGQENLEVGEDGLIKGFNWLALLAPGIRSFFEQSKIDLITNTNSSEGYIVAVDSVVLKFEGLLRKLSKRVEAQTIEKKTDSTSERISYEKLLENKKLKQIISEDDIVFFKYLFTKDGLDLRNNVAHCFFNDSRYSAGLMFLLITALLRLGKYSFKP